MKLNAAGIASAFVFLVAVSVFRLGQQPTFPSEDQEKLWVSRIQEAAKGKQKRQRGEVRALRIER